MPVVKGDSADKNTSAVPGTNTGGGAGVEGQSPPGGGIVGIGVRGVHRSSSTCQGVSGFNRFHAIYGASHVAPVDIGDMLTASPTPSHAMKADDPARAFGAVIGKALETMPSGKGLLPILVCLR